MGLRHTEVSIASHKSSALARDKVSLAVLMFSLPGSPLENLLMRLTHINNIEASSGPIRSIYLDQVMDLRQ